MLKERLLQIGNGPRCCIENPRLGDNPKFSNEF